MKNILLSGFLTCVFIAACNVSGRDIKPLPVVAITPAPEVEFSQEDFKRYHNRVSHFMEQTLLNRYFNGAVLVAKKGTIVYEKYQGFADLRSRDSIGSHTAFHIASTSKTFTAMAVLQLVQEGKLTLDQSLDTWFPSFPYPGITVKDLLTHRSGIPNYLYFLEETGWNSNEKITNEGVLQAIYEHTPAKDAEPNRRFSYCNTNYVLLALIIEKITGRSYPEYMKEKIFTPLHLDDTYVYQPGDFEKATPSFKANGRYWDQDFSDNTYGDKNIYSTPADLLRWSLAVNEGKVISPGLLDQAYQPYSNERPSVHNYGLGWRMLNLKNGKKIIYHNGRWHGSNSAFAYLPEEEVTIIIIGNKYNSNIYRTARKAYDLFGTYLQSDKEDEEEDTPIVKGNDQQEETVMNKPRPQFTAAK